MDIERDIRVLLACASDFILLGPPGSGKTTLLHKIIAAHCHRPTLTLSLSATFFSCSRTNIYAYLSASLSEDREAKQRVEDLQQIVELVKGKKKQHLIVIIDHVENLDMKKGVDFIKEITRLRKWLSAQFLLCGTSFASREALGKAFLCDLPVFTMPPLTEPRLELCFAEWLGEALDRQPREQGGKMVERHNNQLVKSLACFYIEYFTNLRLLRDYFRIVCSKYLSTQPQQRFNFLYGRETSPLVQLMRTLLTYNEVDYYEYEYFDFVHSKSTRRQFHTLYFSLFRLAALLCSRESPQRDVHFFLDRATVRRKKSKRPKNYNVVHSIPVRRLIAATESLESCLDEQKFRFEQEHRVGHSLFFYSDLNSAIEAKEGIRQGGRSRGKVLFDGNAELALTLLEGKKQLRRQFGLSHFDNTD